MCVFRKLLVYDSLHTVGKTAAFLLPTLERLLFRPTHIRFTRVLILTPTRELAMQIHSVGKALSKHMNIEFCLVAGECHVEMIYKNFMNFIEIKIDKFTVHFVHTFYGYSVSIRVYSKVYLRKSVNLFRTRYFHLQVLVYFYTANVCLNIHIIYYIHYT